VVPQPIEWLMTGAVTSTFQVTVRVQDVDVLLHASVTVQVRVCERKQPLLVTGEVLTEGVRLSQLSVTVTVPKPASISAAVGLH